jgi:hypothetical protein
MQKYVRNACFNSMIIWEFYEEGGALKLRYHWVFCDERKKSLWKILFV